MWDHNPTKVGVFGISGSGKSTYVGKYLRNAPFDVRFCFDPDGGFARLLGIRPSRTLPEMIAQLRAGWVVFDPGTMFPADYEKGAAWFAAWSFEWSSRLSGRKVWACDELWKYVTSFNLPPDIRNVILTGRHHGLDCCFIAQQPNQLHNLVRAQLTEVVLFNLTEKQALKWAESRGFDPGTVSRLRPAFLRTPPCGEYLVRTLDGREHRGALYGPRVKGR